MTDRLCNVCKRTKPHTPDYFSWRHGNPANGLCVVCTPCLEKHFRKGRQPAEQRYPYRPSWLVQGGLWADLRHTEGR